MTVGRVSSDTADRESLLPGPGGEIAPVARRGVLGMLSRGGIVMVAALAGVVATSGTAQAHGCRHVACCHLAKCNDCTRNGCNFSCPSGWTKRSWSCVAGARPILCGECQQGGTNCGNGTSYNCSIMIDQNAC